MDQSTIEGAMQSIDRRVFDQQWMMDQTAVEGAMTNRRSDGWWKQGVIKRVQATDEGVIESVMDAR